MLTLRNKLLVTCINEMEKGKSLAFSLFESIPDRSTVDLSLTDDILEVSFVCKKKDGLGYPVKVKGDHAIGILLNLPMVVIRAWLHNDFITIKGITKKDNELNQLVSELQDLEYNTCANKLKWIDEWINRGLKGRRRCLTYGMDGIYFSNEKISSACYYSYDRAKRLNIPLAEKKYESA